jgi:hypothetical protein
MLMADDAASLRPLRARRPSVQEEAATLIAGLVLAGKWALSHGSS